MSNLPRLKQGSKIKTYMINKELGAGCFGRVYEAIDTSNNNNLVAIKCVSKQLANTSPKAFQLFQAERTILAKIKNENVVGFVDYFESSSVCFLCLEFCNEGDMEQFLQQRKKPIPESEAIEYFLQVLNGFKSLHEHNIVHRDIKLPNILKNNGQLKIADLGFAKELKSDKGITQTVLGTPYTMAPEVLQEQPYGLACDIYSLGVNFYQLLFNKYPFGGRSEPDLVNNIKKQQINFSANGVKISDKMEDLLIKMLKDDHKQRISMVDIWNHHIFDKEDKKANAIGMGNLHNSQINNKQNADFYNRLKDKQQQGQQQEQPVDQNPFQQGQQQQNPFVQEQNVDDQEKNQIMNTYYQKKDIEKDVKNTIKKYLNEINTIQIMQKSVHSSHILPETQINTFYPCFFMLKKLLHQQKRVQKDIKEQNNVFKCGNPEILFKHPLFVSMSKDLNERIEMNQMYFMARQFDMQDLMHQTPNQDIISELNENYTVNSEKFYKQTLINYFINLRDEQLKNLRSNNLNVGQKFQKHAIEILDCLDLNTFFRSQADFNFNDYDSYKESVDYQTRENAIQEKALVIFPINTNNK